MRHESWRNTPRAFWVKELCGLPTPCTNDFGIPNPYACTGENRGNVTPGIALKSRPFAGEFRLVAAISPKLYRAPKLTVKSAFSGIWFTSAPNLKLWLPLFHEKLSVN